MSEPDRTGTPLSAGLDWSAIVRSAASMAIIVLPLAILQNWLRSSDTLAADAPENFLFAFAYLLLAAIAGFGAGKLAGARQLQHGAAAGALTYLIVQGLGGVWKILDGRGAPSLVGVVFLGLQMATCGMLGGLLERRTRRFQ